MRRDENSTIEAAGQDSFLDVTTNIVGILIILVMIVWVRAKNPIVPPSPTAEPTPVELAALQQRAVQIEYDVRRVAQETAAVGNTIVARSAERVALATAIAAAEREIGDRRSQLDAALQEAFDLRRQLDESRATVQRGQSEINEIKSQRPATQQIKHYPTPISRTVLGHEVHFQLKDGRIAYVPLDEFIDDVRSDLRRSGLDIANIADKVGAVGPRNGFEFRYTMDVVMDRNRGVVGLRSKEWQIVPVGILQGESLETSLSAQSEFRSALARNSPRDTTVTLWTYSDSFDAYRQLKEELYRLGYATAGRPLPKGVLIGGSDRGTKSSAQ